MNSNTELCVLVVDDDADIRDLLSTYLEGQGLRVLTAESLTSLNATLTANQPEVILLDVNLGSEDGFAIARGLRSYWHGGLIMLTGRGDVIDRVVGLEIGADDYITKPFELRELLARIRSVGRRSESIRYKNVHPPAAASTLHFAHFSLDLERRELQANKASGTICKGHITLTTGEFDLLHALVTRKGRTVTRDELLQALHNREAGPYDRTIDVQIGRLRRKLGDDGKEPKIIKSVRGVGYLFSPSDEGA